MDLGYSQPLPMGLMSVTAREVAARAVDLGAVVRGLRLSSPAVAIFVAAFGGALLNSLDWGLASLRLVIALNSMSLVATIVLAIGWSIEPDEIERWLARAALAALASISPVLARSF